jgi:hypothetical protein
MITLLAGCAQMMGRLQGNSPTQSADPWVFSECSSEHWPRTDDTDEQRAEVLACSQRPSFSSQSDLDTDLANRHARLDDRRFDVLSVGLMTLTCRRACLDSDFVNVAMLAGLAHVLEPDAVHAAVEPLAMSPAAKKFLAGRILQASADLSAIASNYTPQVKQLFIELPAQIRAERARYFKTHAKHYAAFDALDVAKHRGDPDMLDKLFALRAAYFASCAAPECRYDPFVESVTKEIVLAALTAKDEPLATFEGALFGDAELARNRYATMVYRAQYLEAKQAQELYEAYDKETSAGTDAATLAAKFGPTAPVRLRTGMLWEGGDPISAVLRGSPASYDVVTANVANVRIKNGLAEITFSDTVQTYEARDCVETNKISGITKEGNVVYHQSCRSAGTATNRFSNQSIKVSPRDVAGLRPGEEVTAFADDTRIGGILAVRNKRGQLVQFRMHRLRPDTRYAAISKTAHLRDEKWD